MIEKYTSLQLLRLPPSRREQRNPGTLNYYREGNDREIRDRKKGEKESKRLIRPLKTYSGTRRIERREERGGRAEVKREERRKRRRSGEKEDGVNGSTQDAKQGVRNEAEKSEGVEKEKKHAEGRNEEGREG